MNYLKKRKEFQKRQIDGVESVLSSAFAPVSPSQDFITYLGDRLSDYPQPIWEERSSPFKWYQYMMLAVITILGGGVLLAFVIRIVISWVAWLSLVRQLSRGSPTRILDV
jgi:hypothetical protein